MADRYCRNCGHELAQNDRFCANCGKPVHETAHVPTPEADAPVPPPPQQARGTAQPPPQQQVGATTARGSGGARKLLLGCLGILVVTVLLGALVSALAGGGGDQTSSPPERAEQDEGLEGGGNDPEAKQPLQGERAKPQDGQQQQQKQVVEEPRPIILSGSGPQATRLFQLEPGLTVIEMTHQGDANFIVDLLDENGNSVAPMGVANVIGPFQGSTPMQIQRGGQHLLDVQTNGQWQIVVKQPRAASAPQKTNFSGNSQQATQLFELSGGLHRVHMTHQGDANFIVDLLDENGASVVPMGLANEIGPFDGSRAMQVPEDGIYLFAVQANGPWTISVD